MKPLAGRVFDSTDARYGAPKTVVLGFDFWQRHFLGARDVVGKTIELDGAPATVLGVLPESFDFAASFTPGRRADVFLPFALSPETDRQGNTLALIGRLRDGVTVEAAQHETVALAASFSDANMNGRSRNGFAPNISPLRENVSGRFDSALAVLTGAVGFLMLLVCANLSNLLLVRAAARRGEMALRTALGAPRHRLVRQMLAESVVLSGAGATLGIVLALGGTRLVSRIQGTTVPLLNAVHVDGVALAFTVAVAVLTGIAFGMLPAFHASAFELASILAEGARGSTARGGRIRSIIVVAEVAAVCVLLVGAGLLARSLSRVLEVQPGFATENVLSVRVDQRRSGATATQYANYFDAIASEVRSIPGVQSVGFTDALPLGDNFGWRRWDARVAGAPRPTENGTFPLVRMIDEDYLATLGIRLRSGRSFTTADGEKGEPVIVINEALAKKLWPGQDAVGRYLITSEVTRRVVGVVGNVRYFGLDRDSDAEMYMPLRQVGDFGSVDVVVRGTLPASAMTSSVRAALRRADPSLPIPDFHTMEQLVDRSVFARRFIVQLVSGFAAFGLLLASLGIYAVISYSVTQRTQEIGIRMALGASPGQLLTGVLGETARLALLGVAIGLPASWLAGRAIRALLFGVGTSDPWTFTLVLGLLGGVAAVAGLIPARRAASVDPVVALKPR